MDWLLHKYIGIISTRLERFKRKGNGIYNFRCPICGDSETNKAKARGYIYERQGKHQFHCHNCSVTMSVPNFIKYLDQNVYNEYRLEKMQDVKPVEQLDYEKFIEKMKKPAFLTSGPLRGLKKVSQLKADHRVKQLVDLRKIPNPYHAKLFSCPNFKHFVNELVPGKFDEASLLKDETRLLIPFFDKHKNLHALTGRALGNTEPRYLMIVLDETVPKVYGLDTVDLDKPTYVFEGPLDSVFIPNSIATGGGDLISAISGFDKKNMIICYDNEKRNKETVKKMEKAILQGYQVCIWPDNLQHKDVNEMVMAGLSPEFIEFIIKQNTHRDLKAQLALNSWKKI